MTTIYFPWLIRATDIALKEVLHSKKDVSILNFIPNCLGRSLAQNVVDFALKNPDLDVVLTYHIFNPDNSVIENISNVHGAFKQFEEVINMMLSSANKNQNVKSLYLPDILTTISASEDNLAVEWLINSDIKNLALNIELARILLLVYGPDVDSAVLDLDMIIANN